MGGIAPCIGPSTFGDGRHGSVSGGTGWSFSIAHPLYRRDVAQDNQGREDARRERDSDLVGLPSARAPKQRIIIGPG